MCVLLSLPFTCLDFTIYFILGTEKKYENHRLTKIILIHQSSYWRIRSTKDENKKRRIYKSEYHKDVDVQLCTMHNNISNTNRKNSHVFFVFLFSFVIRNSFAEWNIHLKPGETKNIENNNTKNEKEWKKGILLRFIIFAIALSIHTRACEHKK